YPATSSPSPLESMYTTPARFKSTFLWSCSASDRSVCFKNILPPPSVMFPERSIITTPLSASRVVIVSLLIGASNKVSCGRQTMRRIPEDLKKERAQLSVVLLYPRLDYMSSTKYSTCEIYYLLPQT